MLNHGQCWRLLCGALAALALVAPAGRASAAEPDAGLEVHDVSLWMIDPGAKLANARTAYPSALPITVNSLRSGQASRASRRVAPIGLLTFHGPPTVDLDVDLRTDLGSFLAHWPPGDSLPNRLRWSGSPAYNLVEELDDTSELMFVEGDSWFNKARQGDALYVKRGARSERFLAYDVELKLDAPIRLEGGPNKYRVINMSGQALHDVLIARRTPQGVRVAWIDLLPPGKPAPNKTAPKGKKLGQAAVNAIGDAHATAVKLEGAFKSQAANRAAKDALLGAIDAKKLKATEARALSTVVAAATRANAARQAAEARRKAAAAGAKAESAPGGQLAAITFDKPSEQPKPAAKPAKGLFGGLPAAKPSAGVEVTLSEAMAADSPDTAAKTTRSLWERLAKAGLTAHEIELVVEHYGSLFFESDALVVACRLDPAAIDQMIPLSVFPAPARTVRVGLVLVRNADPQLGQEVDELVAQLGDAKFAVRESAQNRLLELGPLAFPALNKALNHADLEIVIRAERILLNQKQTPNARAGGRAPARGVIRAAPAIINR